MYVLFHGKFSCVLYLYSSLSSHLGQICYATTNYDKCVGFPGTFFLVYGYPIVLATQYV